jgi:hypothetical protein
MKIYMDIHSIHLRCSTYPPLSLHRRSPHQRRLRHRGDSPYLRGSKRLINRRILVILRALLVLHIIVLRIIIIVLCASPIVH